MASLIDDKMMAVVNGQSSKKWLGGRAALALVFLLGMTPRALCQETSSQPANSHRKVLWHDDFESYRNTAALFSGPSKLNRWYGLANGDRRGVVLTDQFAHSGRKAAMIHMDRATRYGNADLYLKLPPDLIAGKRRITYEGWLAFDNIAAHRLILMCEFWTGKETHFGQGPDKLIASVVEYDGPSQTWNKEVTDAHKPFDNGKRQYAQDMNKWHGFKLSCSFHENRQFSFQFDDDVWQWKDLDLYVGRHRLDYTMLEVNVRLYFPRKSTHLPDGKLTARVAVDDVKIVCED